MLEYLKSSVVKLFIETMIEISDAALQMFNEQAVLKISGNSQKDL